LVEDAFERLRDESARALRAWARERFAALARRVVHALQRMAASGSFDDYGFRTLWDEYCHEMQHGPHGLLKDAFEESVDPFVAHAVDQLSATEGKLLTTAAIDIYDEYDNWHGELCPAPDLMERGVRDELIRMAMDRDLSRFGPR
jgi:hypothetical protein